MIPLLAAAAAIGGNFLDPLSAMPGWNRGIRAAERQAERAARKPIDAMAEIAKLDGKRFRHIVTGQIRTLDACQSPRTGMVAFTFAEGCVERSPQKALRWLRNAVEVTS